MNSLLWKQWHENKRYLAIFSAWMIVAACYAVGYEVGHRFRAMVGHFSVLALFYTTSAAIFLAMRTACGEQTVGTHSFSASLPVSMRRMATFRIAGAVATLAIPILMAAVLLSIALASGLVEQGLPRGTNALPRLPQRGVATLITAQEQLWSVAAIAICGGVELLLVLSLFGCWLRSQAQVGLLGAVMALGSLIAAGLLWFGERLPKVQLFYGALFPQSLMIQWGYGSEQGSYTDHEIAQYHWIALGLAIPLLIIFGRIFVTQYGLLRQSVITSKPGLLQFATPAILSYIPFRWPGRWMALFWLELRQSVPLVSFGLILALLMAVAQVLVEGHHSEPIAPLVDIKDASVVKQVLAHSRSFRASVLMEMPHSTWAVGMLWAVVVGSSLYSAELGGGLGAFWRSRPISSRMWFWCKYLLGLVAVLIVLDGITILISWNSPRMDMTSGMSWAYVACMPIVHAFMYTLAVLGTCWIRKPVIGGFLAIFGFAVLTIGIEAFAVTRSLEPTSIYNALLMAERDGRIDFSQHGYPLVYGVLTIGIVIIAMLSSRLARPLQPTSRWFMPMAG